MFPEYSTQYAQWEFQQHGEYQLLQKLAPLNFGTVFDVGANCGEWTRMARTFMPNATIHLFEIAPFTYRKLLKNLTLDEKMIPNNFGLSNQFGEAKLKYVPDNDRVSTLVQEIRHDNSEMRTALTVPGDTYANMHAISYIDYLKIDTEGHEYFVLQGFLNLLKENRVGAIQFEYGFISVLTKWLLVDFYKLLTPLGYELGKLTPEGVVFKEFNLTDEDFKGPDYVAVHKTRQDIKRLIQK